MQVTALLRPSPVDTILTPPRVTRKSAKRLKPSLFTENPGSRFLSLCYRSAVPMPPGPDFRRMSLIMPAA